MDTKNKVQYRAALVERSAIDTENKLITLSFSSETPVERVNWQGEYNEVLSHDTSAVDLSFLGSGNAPLLWAHDQTQVIGVVENCAVVDRRGKAVCRFGNSVKAQEVFADIVDGILSNVSVGYVVDETMDAAPIDDEPTVVATKWTPLEISIVSVPADTSVGIGRSKQELNNNNENMEEVKMTTEIKTTNVETSFNVEEVRASARKDELARVQGINTLAARFGLTEKANEFIGSGSSVDAFRNFVLEQVEQRSKDASIQAVGNIGLTETEKKNYSLVRAINAMLTKDWTHAGYERELSQEASMRSGKTTSGLLIPHEVLAVRAAQQAGATGLGKELVANNLLAGEFIDPLYNKTVASQLGVQFMNGLIGNVDIPKGTSGQTYWLSTETTDITASEYGTSLIAMSPKTVGGLFTLTRRAIQQTTPAIENLVRNDLMKMLAVAVDKAVINGSGTNGEPLGIMNTSGVGALALGTNGGSLTWANILAFISMVEAANLDGKAWLTNPQVVGKLRATQRVSGTDSRMIMEEVAALAGYGVTTTNSVPSTLTKGTGTKLSAMMFGDFSQTIVGGWGALEISATDSDGALFRSGQIAIRGFMDIDVAVRNPEGIVVCRDIITA